MTKTADEANWLVVVEAINFNSTLFDVDDLSTIRGGGEAMLAAPHWLLNELGKSAAYLGRCEILQAAASRAIARITLKSQGEKNEIAGQIVADIDNLLASTSTVAALEALQASRNADDMLAALLPHLPPHLTFAVAAVPEGEGLFGLEKAARISQMRRFSVDIPSVMHTRSVSTNRPCTQDWVRPRQVVGIMPDGSQRDLSLSAALRRQLGRTVRRDQFYRRILDDAGIGLTLPPCGFAHEFGELVEQPDAAVPDTVAGKMVLVSLDANNISSVRAKTIASADTSVSFALAFKAMRARFLHGLLTWAAQQPFMLLDNPKRSTINGDTRTLPILRLETLVWGADEMAFVLPGWALEPFLVELSALLDAKHWTFNQALGGDTVTHAIGMVISSAKAPIRSLRNLVESLQQDAKAVDRKTNMLQYWVAGSIDMPTRNLQKERAALFGVADDNDQSHAFTLPLDHVAQGLTLLRRIKGESGNKAVGIPRQKLANLCQAPLDRDATEAALTQVLEKGSYVDGAGRPITNAEVLTSCFFAATAQKGEGRMRFRHMLELWPFVDLSLEGNEAGRGLSHGAPA